MFEKIAFAGASLIIILLLPPLLDGIARKIKAILQSRQGPPLLQTYYDISTLLSMEPILPTDRLGFIVAPYAAFAAALSAGLVLPFGNFIPVAFTGDIFVFLYVLAIFSISMMMAGFLVNNTYANAGANREMMIILSVEPILGVALGIFALKTHTLSISGIPMNLTITPSVILAFIFLAYSIYVECAFIPFDVAEAETEILEGPFVEYSGRLLGIFKWAMLIKRVVLIWLFVSFIVLPIMKNIVDITSLYGAVATLITQLVMLVVFYATSAVIEATTARMKITPIIKQNTIIFVAGLIALAIASLGL
ncbi:Hydrogenase 4, component C or formate hydrogen lyase subunit 4 [Thermococcus paralvinellae]|uniref:Hydrogenase 4, component C or formate hydrogen lyase subunit 4 n=2 Tax=Thermococcus paralvinellae TaxID=582419 RepID=W0I490_9EURY|nr:Hydrogenase 4, component C or formate hydrogen lyase subunit 4 [Thermococcus paralvinellae]